MSEANDYVLQLTEQMVRKIKLFVFRREPKSYSRFGELAIVNQVEWVLSELKSAGFIADPTIADTVASMARICKKKSVIARLYLTDLENDAVIAPTSVWEDFKDFVAWLAGAFVEYERVGSDFEREFYKNLEKELGKDQGEDQDNSGKYLTANGVKSKP